MAEKTPAKKPATKKTAPPPVPVPQTVTFKYELGCTVKDIISGFEGLVMIQSMHFNGCIRYYVESTRLKPDGTRGLASGDTFDESQLEFIAPPTPKIKAATLVTSGDALTRSVKGGPAQRGEESLRRWTR